MCERGVLEPLMLTHGTRTSPMCEPCTQAEVPFINLTAKPELRECFLKCVLPHQGLRLEHVTIESSDGQALATWRVEVHGSIQP